MQMPVDVILDWPMETVLEWFEFHKWRKEQEDDIQDKTNSNQGPG